MLGGNPTREAPAATNLLYSGEQFDAHLQQYYLRARYYDQNTGRFNGMDPFGGNLRDPLSLNKYLYCDGNPLNAIDPSGEEFSTIQQMASFAIISVLISVNIANAPGPHDPVFRDATEDMYFDAYFTIGAGVLIRHVIIPAARTTIRYVGSRLKIPLRASSPGAPGEWIEVKEHMSPRAAQYQTRITGKPIDQSYVVNGVKFDGFQGGTLLDAKSSGYKDFVENGRFSDWFTGKQSLLDQAQRQVTAAGGTPVEWHVADKEAIPAFKELLKDTAAESIKIVHTPIGQ